MFPQQFPIEPVRWLQVCFLVFKDTVMVFNLPLSLLLTSNFALTKENIVSSINFTYFLSAIFKEGCNHCGKKKIAGKA